MKYCYGVFVSFFLMLFALGPMAAHARDEVAQTQAMLNVARHTDAKLEKPEGKVYPMFTDDMAEFMKFNQDLYGVLAPEMGNIQGDKEGVRTFQIFSAAWRKLGYSFDSTIYKTYSGISPDQYMWLGRTRRAESFLPLIMILANESTLKKALADGVVSRASVVAYLEGTLNLLQAVAR